MVRGPLLGSDVRRSRRLDGFRRRIEPVAFEAVMVLQPGESRCGAATDFEQARRPSMRHSGQFEDRTDHVVRRRTAGSVRGRVSREPRVALAVQERIALLQFRTSSVCRTAATTASWSASVIRGYRGSVMLVRPCSSACGNCPSRNPRSR